MTIQSHAATYNMKITRMTLTRNKVVENGEKQLVKKKKRADKKKGTGITWNRLQRKAQTMKMNERFCAMDYVRSSAPWLNVRKEIPKNFVQTSDRILDNILGCEALLFCSLHVVVFNNGKWVVDRSRREGSLFFVNTTPQVAFVKLINHCNK